jgi:hypothetical protein
MLFALLFLTVALVAGGIAVVTGFGIGSLLARRLGAETRTNLAVGVVAIRTWSVPRRVSRYCAGTWNSS